MMIEAILIPIAVLVLCFAFLVTLYGPSTIFAILGTVLAVAIGVHAALAVYDMLFGSGEDDSDDHDEPHHPAFSGEVTHH